VKSLSSLTRPLLRTVRKGELWCALLALSLGLSIASPIFVDLTSSGGDQIHLRDRTIETVVDEGIEAPRRTASYGRLYLVLGGSFFVLFVLLSLLNGALRQRVEPAVTEKERSGVLLLSEFSLVLFVLRLFAADAVPEILRTGLHYLTLLLILAMVAKVWVSTRVEPGSLWTVALGYLNDDQLMLAGLFLPAPLMFAFGLFLNGPLPAGSPQAFFVLYGALLLALVTTYLLVANLLAGGSRLGMVLALKDMNGALILAGVPVILIPLALPVANELQSAWRSSDPRYIAMALVTALVMAAGLLFVLQRHGRLKLSKAALLHRWYFPVFVVTLVTFRTHAQSVNLGVLEFFRQGELTLPTQQWFQFGKLPLLDLVPNHGLSDVLLQSVYSLLNGDRGLDMLVWLDWLPEVVGLLLVYAFLAVITSPVMALLSTVLLPVTAVVIGPSVLGLLPAVLLVAAVRLPTFKRFLLLWCVTAGMVFWRPEVGLTMLVALVLIVAVFILSEYREALSAALGSLCVVLGLIPVMILAAEVFWSGDTYQTMQTFFGLFRDLPTLAATDPTVAPGSAVVTIFQSQVLPAVALLCVLYFGLQKLVGSGPFPDRAYAVLFLALCSLLLTMRSVGWNGRAGGFDPFLLLVVLAVIPFYVMGRRFHPRMLGQSGWFFGVVLLSLAVGIATGGHLSAHFDSYHLFPRGRVFGFHEWKAGERRVQYDPGPRSDLVDYLQREIQGERTFFDFTNAPLLYVLTEKRYPATVIPDFRLMSEEIQAKVLFDLEGLRQDKRLPLAILGSSAGPGGQRAGFPGAAASYRVAEYLYRHYVPYATLGDYQLWRGREVWKRRQPEPPAEPLAPEQVSQHFRLGRFPYLWGRHDPWEAATKTVILAPLVEEELNLRAAEVLPLQVAIDVDRAGGNYLHIRARSLPPPTEESDGKVSRMSVVYGQPTHSSFTFDLVPWSFEPHAEDEVMELEMLENPVRHHMRRFEEYPGRLVFLVVGQDPYLHQFADLASSPSMDAEHELLVRLVYRSSVAGTAQVFFAARAGRFNERQSVKVYIPMAELEGAPRAVIVPVVGGGPSNSLADLRVDPPQGAIFEVVGVEVIRRRRRLDDYLIRLTTQWQWVSTDVNRLVLRTDAPVLIDSVLLRGGD